MFLTVVTKIERRLFCILCHFYGVRWLMSEDCFVFPPICDQTGAIYTSLLSSRGRWFVKQIEPRHQIPAVVDELWEQIPGGF